MPTANQRWARRGSRFERYTFDARGCPLSERYFDARGVAAKSRFNAYGVDYKVDVACRPTAGTCVAADGSVSSCAEGEHARIELAYDAEGNVISTRFFSASGKPAKGPQFGVFERRTPRDDRGRTISTACFNADKKASEVQQYRISHHAHHA